MNWIEVCIHTTNEAIEPINNVLNEAGISGVVIEDPLDLIKERETFFGEIYQLNPNKYPSDGVFLKVYLPDDKYFHEKLKEIKQAITNLLHFNIDLGNNRISLNEIQEQDWETAWKKHYKPVKISDKITIVPSWEEYQPSNEEVVIELDPGMAFGTGTHPTTMLSIQALEHYVKKNDFVIDVGCGSGILSIAAALLGAKKVFSYDLDDVAVKSTILNTDLNKLSDKVLVKQNNLLTNVDVQVDIIVSNILAEIIVQFPRDAWRNLKHNGLFITSGIIKRKKDLVLNELLTVGFKIIEINEIDGWLCIVAKKHV